MLASVPARTSSALTFGPTNSTRRYESSPGISAASASFTAATARCCAVESPGWRSTRTSTSVSRPNSCNATSPRSRPDKAPRIRPRSAGSGVPTSIRMPPSKSIP